MVLDMIKYFKEFCVLTLITIGSHKNNIKNKLLFVAIETRNRQQNSVHVYFSDKNSVNTGKMSQEC